MYLYYFFLNFRMNFSDIEIEILFCKYDIDGSGNALDMDEVENMLEDLDDGDFDAPAQGGKPNVEQGASSQGVKVSLEDINA